jgi:hypothetical protein
MTVPPDTLEVIGPQHLDYVKMLMAVSIPTALALGIIFFLGLKGSGQRK